MASITTADFKNGIGLRIKDKVVTIVEFQHVKPGKGGAFVRYKTKDLKTGRVVEQTCNAGTKFESVTLTTTEMQYLYNDGDHYYFMNMETYDQVPVPVDFIGDNAKWLKENDICQLLYADDELMGVNPPMFIEVEITQTDPGFKGDTVQGSTKPATIETGATIQVPMYLKIERACEVYFYLGKEAQRLNEPKLAFDYFHLCARTDKYDFLEYRYALFEIRRMARAHQLAAYRDRNPLRGEEFL